MIAEIAVVLTSKGKVSLLVIFRIADRISNAGIAPNKMITRYPITVVGSNVDIPMITPDNAQNNARVVLLLKNSPMTNN
jgi:hypothetical protein